MFSADICTSLHHLLSVSKLPKDDFNLTVILTDDCMVGVICSLLLAFSLKAVN